MRLREIKTSQPSARELVLNIFATIAAEGYPECDNIFDAQVTFDDLYIALTRDDYSLMDIDEMVLEHRLMAVVLRKVPGVAHTELVIPAQPGNDDPVEIKIIPAQHVNLVELKEHFNNVAGLLFKKDSTPITDILETYRAQSN